MNIFASAKLKLNSRDIRGKMIRIVEFDKNSLFLSLANHLHFSNSMTNMFALQLIMTFLNSSFAFTVSSSRTHPSVLIRKFSTHRKYGDATVLTVIKTDSIESDRGERLSSALVERCVIAAFAAFYCTLLDCTTTLDINQ